MKFAVGKILQKFGEFLFHKVYPKIENRNLRIKVLEVAGNCFDTAKSIYLKDRRKSK